MLNIKNNGLISSGVFKNIDLTLGNTGLVFVCGRKESSAKNLIKYLAGVEYLPGLQITIDDYTLTNNEQLDEYRLQNIGYAFGNTQYIEGQTVLANVFSSVAPFVQNLSDEYINNILNKTGLLEKASVLTNELSEFELHCLDIARALAKDPKVIIANNPIARLNKEESTKIWNLLKELSNDYLVVVGNALQATAKEYGDLIIAFNAVEVNHVMNETIELTPIHEFSQKTVESKIKKEHKFTFPRLFNISSSLIKGGLFVALLMALTIVAFLMSASTKYNAHYKFAESLSHENIHMVRLVRNTDRTDYLISEDVRNDIDSKFPNLSIQWGYFLGKEVNKQYESHSKNTGYKYPETVIQIREEDKANINLLYGSSWDDSASGIYLSETEAEKYIAYFNANKTSKSTNAKKLTEAVAANGYKDITITNPEDLVGKLAFFSFNTKNFDLFKVVGIYEDKEDNYLNNIVICPNYDFATNNPNFDKDNNFFSTGIATLSSDMKENADFLNYSATILRNEREKIYISTALDEQFSELYYSVANLVTILNISAILLLILTIASSIIFSYLLINNYRKELTLSRTYGLSKNEIIKVSAILNSILAVVGLIAGIVITIIIQLIVNSVIKGNNAFVAYSFLTIPSYALLIALGATILLAGVFVGLSVKALNDKDYLVY